MSMVYGSLPPSVGASCGTSSFYAQRYPNTAAHTQLAEAMWFLQNHRESVTLVTIDIGANDVGSALGVDSVLTNLPVILSSLRAAAGAALPIVGMNYYDPFLPIVWSTSGHDLGALQSRVNEIVAFNGLLAFLYGQFADPVADVQTQFQVTEMALVGVTPLNVLRECQWTWICVPPATDIHANTAGYGEIAKAFEALFP